MGDGILLSRCSKIQEAARVCVCVSGSKLEDEILSTNSYTDWPTQCVVAKG